MASKNALKAIKAAIDSSDFQKAIDQAQELVKSDPKNHTAFLFLGFAQEKLNNFEAAEKAIISASKLKPQDPQAYKGLVTLYEKQGSTKLDQYHNTVAELAEVYANLEDREQCQNVVDKYESFVKKHGTPSQYRKGLGLILPTSNLYEILQGRVMQPSLAYQRILESAEAEEKQWINTQIGERRTRLGAKIDQVTQEVKSEAIQKFQVEEKYAALIDWTKDDEIRHKLEEKLFQRAYDNLQFLPLDLKPMQRDRVLNLANGMVIIKQPFPLAWKIALEWVDAQDLRDWDVNILREYASFFPEDGLSKVLRGFLESKASPFPAEPKAENGDEEENVPLSEAEQLILMNEGIEDCPDSLLGHRMMAQVYLVLEEWESTTSTARKAQQLYQDCEVKNAIQLQNSIDGVNLMLGNALIQYQSPRHHSEAKLLFEDILSRKPLLTAALLGVGLVYEEDEDYPEAVRFLQQASDRDPDNLRIRPELAWCRALNGDLRDGLAELNKVLEGVQKEKPVNLSMKSEVLYRIAYCQWHINTAASARKDKAGPYKYLIDSIKANPSYAPAYTLLGVYFQDYAKSKPRARVALQKAFELSTSEIGAAERLARAFADTGEWELVELVAQRVISSGKAKPAPGSKKKAYSWPFAALGVVQVNKQQFAQAIVSFQAALRISPHDYNSWVGLGESYHNSGRYVAASRTFAKAESIDHGLPQDQTWFAKYMLANVQREMGSFDEAIYAYQGVLEIKPDELGVLIALLQTLAESAWTKVVQGRFGEAATRAQQAISVAIQVSHIQIDTFNLWKAVGDACSVLGHVKAFAQDADLESLIGLLQRELQGEEYTALADQDKVDFNVLSNNDSATIIDPADKYLLAAILSYKRAISASATDVHARAISWYNLGWAEHQAYVSCTPSIHTKSKKPQRFLKAAMKCFKRAIELEAGNSEFWNALGVVTMTLSPKVSQHSFVRSLHLNENIARTWTNLGVLYLLNNDNELANQAFTHAQSADPEYAEAWIGQGLLASLYGNVKEARGLFMHAFDISDSGSIPAKPYYAMSAFDQLVNESLRSPDISTLLQPLFAMRQLHALKPNDAVVSHLMALFAERVGDYDSGTVALQQVCDQAEAEYEKSESNEALARFVQAKIDLARAYLGKSDFESAVENAETALDLTSEDDLGANHATTRKKWRLSAYVTAGLAHSHLKAMDQSIKMFQAALEESNHAPDIVCMLAQVLWAKGEAAEKEAARSQLFACVENHPGNVQAVTLLAVIGLLDSDNDIIEAVEDELKTLRNSDKVSVTDKMKVTKVLSAILASKRAEGGLDASATITDALNGIMLAPGQPQGWLELSQVAGGDQYVAAMALQNAVKQIPPNGSLQAEDLARAYAGTGRDEDRVQAKMLAPWLDQQSL